jgi:hypothetical protein
MYVTSKRDYFLMAEVFREVYLKNQQMPYPTPEQLFLELVTKFMTMLQKDNARFNRVYFMNFIKEGRVR